MATSAHARMGGRKQPRGARRRHTAPARPTDAAPPEEEPLRKPGTGTPLYAASEPATLHNGRLHSDSEAETAKDVPDDIVQPADINLPQPDPKPPYANADDTTWNVPHHDAAWNVPHRNGNPHGNEAYNPFIYAPQKSEDQADISQPSFIYGPQGYENQADFSQPAFPYGPQGYENQGGFPQPQFPYGPQGYESHGGFSQSNSGRPRSEFAEPPFSGTMQPSAPHAEHAEWNTPDRAQAELHGAVRDFGWLHNRLWACVHANDAKVQEQFSWYRGEHARISQICNEQAAQILHEKGKYNQLRAEYGQAVSEASQLRRNQPPESTNARARESAFIADESSRGTKAPYKKLEHLDLSKKVSDLEKNTEDLKRQLRSAKLAREAGDTKHAEDLADKQATIARLTDNLSAIRKKARNVESKHAKETTSMMKNSEDLTRRLQSAELRLEQRQTEHDRQLAEKQASIAELTKCLSAEERKAHKHAKETDSMIKNSEDLTRRLQSAELRLEQRQTEHDRQLAEKQASIAKLTKRLSAEERKTQELVNEHATAIEKLTAGGRLLEAGLRGQEEDTKNLREQLERAATSQSILSTRIKTLKESNDELTKQLREQKESEIAMVARHADELEKKIAEAVKQATRDEQSKSKKGRQRDELRAALHKCEQERDQLRETLANRDAECAEYLEERLSSLDALAIAGKSRTSTLQEELSASRSELENVSLERDRVKVELSITRRDLAQTTEALYSHHEKEKARAKQLEELEALQCARKQQAATAADAAPALPGDDASAETLRNTVARLRELNADLLKKNIASEKECVRLTRLEALLRMLLIEMSTLNVLNVYHTAGVEVSIRDVLSEFAKTGETLEQCVPGVIAGVRRCVFLATIEVADRTEDDDKSASATLAAALHRPASTDADEEPPNIIEEAAEKLFVVERLKSLADVGLDASGDGMVYARVFWYMCFPGRERRALAKECKKKKAKGELASGNAKKPPKKGGSA